MSQTYTGLDVIDGDHYFVVDPMTRKITSKQPQKDILMQYDHNSERFTFEIPRFIEGRDISLCNTAQVLYTNGGKSGVYAIDDLVAYPVLNDVAICSWLISQEATSSAGSLSFMLRFAQVTEEDVVEYAWSTQIYDGITVIKSISGVYNGGY